MNFISEHDVEEAKQKRAAEWEKARSEGRKIPEEEVETFRDRRPLYERLKEQKDRKQEEFEEQLKFKNMIYKGLNEEDANFLEMVAKKKAEVDNLRFNEQSEELKEYRTAVEEQLYVKEPTKPKNKVSAEFSTQKKNSQRDLLTKGIVRKRKSTEPQTTTIDKKQACVEGIQRKDVVKAVAATTTSSISNLASYASSSEENEDEDSLK